MTIDQAATHGPPRLGAEPARALPVGETLRARREELGWSLAEVAAWLRIKQTYLQALEDGRPQDLPGSTYALGFLRSYASGLGLDARQLGQRFRDEASLGVPRPNLSFPAPVPERGVPAGAAVLLGVVLLGAAYTGWYIYGGSEKLPTQTLPPAPLPLPLPPPRAAPQSPESPAPPQASETPPPQAGTTPQPRANETPPPQTGTIPQPQTGETTPPQAGATPRPQASQIPPAPTAPVPSGAPAPIDTTSPAAAPPPHATVLTIKASAASWVQIRAPGGTVLYEHILQPGESWSAPASEQGLLLSTGNAGGITVSAGDVSTPLLGASGAVRRNLPISADAVRDGSLVAPAPGQKPPFLAGSGAGQPAVTSPARAGAGQAKPEQ